MGHRSRPWEHIPGSFFHVDVLPSCPVTLFSQFKVIILCLYFTAGLTTSVCAKCTVFYLILIGLLPTFYVLFPRTDIYEHFDAPTYFSTCALPKVNLFLSFNRDLNILYYTFFFFFFFLSYVELFFFGLPVCHQSRLGDESFS